MKIVPLIIALVVAFPIAAKADLRTDIAKCAVMGSVTSRVVCYDQIAIDLKVDVPRIDTVAGVGKWKASVETSPIDDSKNAFLTLDAETPVRQRYDTTTPILFIRCKERKLQAYISYGNLFIGSDSTKVLTRLDKSPARTATWGISTDHKAVFVGGNVMSFVKDLAKSESLLVELTPYSESPVMTTFDLRGLADVSKPLQQICPWH